MSIHPDALDLYVMDALSDERRDAIEAHVSECAECAAALAREARLELQLRELASTPPPARVVPLRRRRVARYAVAAAAAAIAATVGAALLWRRAPAPQPIVVACPFDESAPDCLARARQHGLYVQLPSAVPIYEDPFGASGSLAVAE
jgi:anti-sigma factor RsiW